MKQYKFPNLGMYLEEVYVERNTYGGYNPPLPLVVKEFKLTEDPSKARRIMNKEIQAVLESKGFEPLEVLDKVDISSWNDELGIRSVNDAIEENWMNNKLRGVFGDE